MSFRACHVCGETDRLELRFRKGEYQIVRCAACGLVYTNEIPSPAVLEAVYGESFFQVGQKFAGHSGSVGLVNAARRVDRLLALPEIGRERWLDVGCATGDFLEAARTAGVTDGRGVELSTWAAAVARDRGFDVTAADFSSVRLEPASLDLVTMWDYIEHVPDPASSLQRAFAALRPGGYIAISTGDTESVVARLMGRYWHLMIPPRHLYFFSPRTLAQLLEDAGFRMVRLGRPGKRVPLDFAAWKAATIAAPRLASSVLRAAGRIGLGRLQPSLNLLDIMTVHARKP